LSISFYAEYVEERSELEEPAGALVATMEEWRKRDIKRFEATANLLRQNGGR
jgi:hypothetical protein